MQLHLDENVYRSQADALRKAGYDVYEVTRDKEVRNKGVSDEKQALEAQKNNRILVTQDKDFTALREQKGIPTTGVVYARASAVDSPDYDKKLAPVLKEHQAALERGAFITVSANKVKVREYDPQRSQQNQQERSADKSKTPEKPAAKLDAPAQAAKDTPSQSQQAPDKAQDSQQLSFKRDSSRDADKSKPTQGQAAPDKNQDSQKLQFKRDAPSQDKKPPEKAQDSQQLSFKRDTTIDKGRGR